MKKLRVDFYCLMKKVNCILIIDDNLADNEYHQLIINKSNVCNIIKVVHNGVEAIDYLKNMETDQSGDFPRPDFLFLDINMPKMNGFEFLDEYAKFDEKLKIKVIIMLSVPLNPEGIDRALGYKEMVGFIPKPLTTQLMKETIKKYETYKAV